MKVLILVMAVCLLAGCTLIFIEVNDDLTCGDIDINKNQNIEPATDVSLIPK